MSSENRSSAWVFGIFLFLGLSVLGYLLGFAGPVQHPRPRLEQSAYQENPCRFDGSVLSF
jgi:hypothetical protein